LTEQFIDLRNKALNVLHKATCERGILALPNETTVENYTRIWARDSIMAGLVGLDYGDSIIIDGLKKSLDTLKNQQTPQGIIPSNVSIDDTPTVSYGGTAGRVDATLWYIIGALKYISFTKDDHFRKAHIWHIEKALQVCIVWEFNNKNLIYTPLSGNWADEYPIHGYTLYDNCLRLWGLELYTQIIKGSKAYLDKANEVRNAIKDNFRLSINNKATKYHELLYNREIVKGEKPYFIAGFNPSRYYTMFDAGGNGLALSLGLLDEDSLPKFISYLELIFDRININLAPAFWPIIDEKDDLYQDLKSNFAYTFKNKPHHFHNGGIWPIMNGWLAKGLSRYNEHSIINKMKNAYLQVAIKENFRFSEYISSDSHRPRGKSPLCYSATGALMLIKLLV